MKAARLHAIGKFQVDDVPKPEPVGEQLLLKVGACGICGSDIPRIFELGLSKPNYPLTLGHEFGGTIVAVGKDADQSLINRRGAIFPLIPCLKCSSCISGNYAMCENYDYLGSRSDGGFAEYCLIPSAWHFVPTESDQTTDEMLAMTEPCTVAQHSMRTGNVCAGKGVLIFGAGPIGIMAARWAHIFGADPVLLVDVADDKVQFGTEHGEKVINSMKEDVAETFKKLSGGKLADVVIEGTGSGPALGQAIECARPFGNIVLMGNPSHDTTIKLKQHSLILRKELHINGMWNSHFADTPINEWTYTVKMMDRGRMKVLDLITHRTDLPGLPKLCADIHDRKVSICKAMYSTKLQGEQG